MFILKKEEEDDEVIPLRSGSQIQIPAARKNPRRLKKEGRDDEVIPAAKRRSNTGSRRPKKSLRDFFAVQFF